MKNKKPEWIVNCMGELGVIVDGVAYFLYKGGSLVYGNKYGNISYRRVGKREFGEVCLPVEQKIDRDGIYRHTYPDGDEWKELEKVELEYRSEVIWHE